MMRIVSVWLPRWPILRFLATQARHPSPSPVDPERPFALYVDAAGGPRIAALNEAADREGLAVGDSLADARAKTDRLQTRPADSAADDAALRRLGLWAMRYAPAVSLFEEEDGADGFFIDATGVAHLFGGETALLTDLRRRLDRFGFSARLAIADTAGAAWALTRRHARPRLVLPSGEEAGALRSLPVEALRLPRETCLALRRLGFKTIGPLIDAPRAPFAARFEKELLRRLDQALGRAPEPRAFLAPPSAWRALRRLLEPVFSQAAILAVASRLFDKLVPDLHRDGAGARALELALYGVDGARRSVRVEVSEPTRARDEVMRLFALEFERVGEALDGEFGFDAVGLEVIEAERLTARQADLAPTSGEARRERRQGLVDALRQRLGDRHVRRLHPFASHIPERAEIPAPAPEEDAVWPQRAGAQPRPALILPRAEEAKAISLVPQQQPKYFVWRGKTYGVARLQGPERIASEWWRSAAPQPPRDYYIAEDEKGRRFWLYREEDAARASPRWFMHGLFA